VKDGRGTASFWDRATWLIGSVLRMAAVGCIGALDGPGDQPGWEPTQRRGWRAQGGMRAVNAVSVARLVLWGKYCLRSFGGSKDDGRLRWMALTRFVRGLSSWGRRLSRACLRGFGAVTSGMGGCPAQVGAIAVHRSERPGMPTFVSGTGRAVGSAMGAWWSAVEPSAMIVEWGVCRAAVLPDASARGRSCAPRSAAFS
jgi:hypothetical protein